MTEKEQKAFNTIVESETDSYQRRYLDSLLKLNDRFKAPLSEKCAMPAVGRLWKS
jgi:hypothetical protein